MPIGKDSKAGSPAAPASLRQGEESVLGSSLLFDGEITGSQNLVIEGKVQGKITLSQHSLTIARDAQVNAEIRVQNLTLQGSLEGTVQASGKVTIDPRARMSGDITAARISIREGAFFMGNLKIKPGLSGG